MIYFRKILYKLDLNRFFLSENKGDTIWNWSSILAPYSKIEDKHKVFVCLFIVCLFVFWNHLKKVL